MDIEAYEREEAVQQATSATPTTVTQSESPSIDTPATSPSQKRTSREITALDRATSEAQDCFASASDQRMCIPYLERMEEAARTGR